MNRMLVVSGLIACAFALGGCTALSNFDGVAADGAIGDVPVDADGVDASAERDAGNDAGPDVPTLIDAGPMVVCERDENVQANMCTPCPLGTFTGRNDPVLGMDTECDAECANLPCDACEVGLGVPCPTFEDAYVKASNTGVADKFGTVLAVSGDTMVVGAPLEDSDASGVDGDEENNALIDSGAAYVYVRVEGVWEQQAYLKAHNPDDRDRFGSSVAIDGDLIVVGAPFEDSDETGVNGTGANDERSSHGAAYVFERTDGTWEQVAYLKGPDADVLQAGNGSDPGDEWGTSVAVSGALIAIGGPKEDSAHSDPENNGSSNSGRVVLFQRGGDGLWSNLISFKAPNIGDGDEFGSSLALDGTTLVVGAPKEDSSTVGTQAPVSGDVSSDDVGRNVGAVYVFVFNGTRWVLQSYLKPSTFLSGDLGEDLSFGASVALDGNRIVVGATREASPARGVDGDEVFTSGTQLSNAGAAYVFDRMSRTWAQVAYLKASNPDEGDRFGFDVAVSGDVVAVGAVGEDGASPGVGSGDADNTAPSSGAVYIFRHVDDDWRYLAYVKAPFPDAGDVAASVALNGSTLAIGALDEDSSATGVDGAQDNNDVQDSGAVYVRRMNLE